jgi:hypothetical protein
MSEAKTGGRTGVGGREDGGGGKLSALFGSADIDIGGRSIDRSEIGTSCTAIGGILGGMLGTRGAGRELALRRSGGSLGAGRGSPSVVLNFPGGKDRLDPIADA